MLTIKDAFEDYKTVVFDSTSIGLSFWSHFLDHSIYLYFKEYPEKIGSCLNEGIYSITDIDSDSNKGLYKSHEIVNEILADNLKNHKIELFEWTMNLAILKVYNALEILLLRAIKLKYFPVLKDPLADRNEKNKAIAEIKDYLKNKSIKIDTNNNRFLINYLEANSLDFSNFVTLPVRMDRNTTWEGFFEMASIFRNVVAHNSMIVTKDTLNKIEHYGKDIFEQYFDLRKTSSGDTILSPHQNYGEFSTFINYFNDFGLNTVKFIFEEKDFTFLGLK